MGAKSSQAQRFTEFKEATLSQSKPGGGVRGMLRMFRGRNAIKIQD